MARTPKSLILTYHRISDDGAASAFYDVPVSTFRRQVAAVAANRGALPVAITFDDGTKDHLLAGDILAEHGLRGVFFLDLNRLDTRGWLASGEVRRLVELGQTIGSHTITHRQLPTLSDAELAEELEVSRRRLQDLSDQPVEWFAPPGGFYDNRTLPAAHKAGYKFVRTMDWGYAPAALEGQLLPTVPVLRSVSSERFQTILDGRANFAGFALKQFAKRMLPGAAYVRLRDWAVGKGGAPAAL